MGASPNPQDPLIESGSIYGGKLSRVRDFCYEWLESGSVL